MSETRWVVFDVEGDSLKPTKFYCLCYKDHEGKTGELTSYEDIRGFFGEYDVYVGHNIRRWDLPELERVVGISIPRRVVDTLAVAWVVHPGRGSHGLASYGDDYGIQKPPIDDWLTLPLSTYIYRCQQDVEINIRLWKEQIAILDQVYDSHEEIWNYLRYLDFKMVCAALQEKSGWRLDRENCQEGLDALTAELDRKYEALRAAMPPVPRVVSRTRPKRVYKADGEPSVAGARWLALLAERGLPEDHGEPVDEVVGYDKPNPGSHHQVKDWLYSLGWVPQTIKYTRNKETGAMKETPQINKENQKGGGVCDSIKLLYDKEPRLELLDGVGVLSHRIGILRGFIRDVDDDGLLHARVAGLTNTLRFKHAELVNLPKPERAYGDHIRSSLVAPDGAHELCGADMSSLEDRIKQHFLTPKDPDYVASLQSSDYDPHLDIGVLAGLLTEPEASAYKAGDHSKKDVRGVAKNGNYACQYGAGVNRLMITCGIDRARAQKLYDAYWERNWAIRAVAEEQTTKLVGDQLWLFNPISGFWYTLRYEKDIFSTLVQGTAAFLFDLWLREIYRRRPEFTGQFHDEVILTIKKGHQEACRKLLNDAISEVNKKVNLHVALAVDVQFGDRYSDIH